MGGTDDASRLRQRMDEVRGRPEELATLCEIVEQLLVQTDRRLTERPVEATALPPSYPASASGAYLSMAPLEKKIAPAVVERGPSPWPMDDDAAELMEGRQAEIAALSARILENPGGAQRSLIRNRGDRPWPTSSSLSTINTIWSPAA